jgi:hypothetical protein
MPRRIILIDVEQEVIETLPPPAAGSPASEEPWDPGQGPHPNHPIWNKLEEFYAQHPSYDPDRGRTAQSADELEQLKAEATAMIEAMWAETIPSLGIPVDQQALATPSTMPIGWPKPEALGIQCVIGATKS